jgi:hypothetical protein
MNSEFYTKLVDLYAGGELTEELNAEMERAAIGDPDLGHDMMSLRTTVRLMQESPAPEFTEESFQRILLRMRQRGADVEVPSPEPAHWQYRLPIQS